MLERAFAVFVLSTVLLSCQKKTCAPDVETLTSEIFRPSCAQSGCHAATESAAGLNLADSAGLLGRLVNRDASSCEGWKLIVPGVPEKSFLYRKLDDKPACGTHMPVSGKLDADSAACVATWIQQVTNEDACESCGENACIDLTNNALHCGSCANACPAGTSCQGGMCECPAGQSICSNACRDLQSDNANCGACGVTCPSGAACQAGQCACSGGGTVCGGACVDTQSNASHCGTCGNACGGSSPFCRNGPCSATCASLQACGQACVDTQSNFYHCGTCTTVCPTGASCSAGVCQCPAGQTACNGACVDTKTDAANCGGCGLSCSATQACQNGACGCPVGQTLACGICVAGGAVSFKDQVQPIFTATCVDGCHDGSAAGGGPKGGGAQQTVDLRSGNAYAQLVDTLTNQCSDGRKRVSPGNANASYLIQKLKGVQMCQGSQMPKQGQSVAPGDFDVLWKWICANAPSN